MNIKHAFTIFILNAHCFLTLQATESCAGPGTVVTSQYFPEALL